MHSKNFFYDKEYESAAMTSRTMNELGPYLEIYDYDYEAELTNPLEDMYYVLKSEKQTSIEKLIPSL